MRASAAPVAAITPSIEPPVGRIDEREAVPEERVAHVDHVRSPEVHDGVAVRVSVRHVERIQLVPVEVERHVLRERDDGQRAVRTRRLRRRFPADTLQHLVHVEALPDVFVRHDKGPRLSEILVAPRVVPMPVRVEHEADRLGRYRPDGSQNLVGQRRVLVVDDEDSVVADEDSDVAARAEQHVHTRGDPLRLDLDCVEVLR